MLNKAPTPTPAPAPALQREWQAFWLALGFLTRLPMLVKVDYSPQLMNQCSVYFPLVGLLLGALYLSLYSALTLLWPPLIGVLLVVAFHLWITGAFHEDGLADSADALGGGYTVERRLEIMKDSRIGTYGAAALIMALLLKVALLAELTPLWAGLLLAPMVSRLTPLLLMVWLPYVSDPKQSKSKPVAEALSQQRLLCAAAFTAVVALLGGVLLPALFAVLLVAALWGLGLEKKLGGYTGDALGASVVLSELVFLLVVQW